MLLDIEDLIIDPDTKSIFLKEEKRLELFEQEIDPQKTFIVINKADKANTQLSSLNNYNLKINQFKFPVFGIISCKNEYAVNDLIESLSKKVSNFLTKSEHADP
jgi:Predicted GTPases